MKTIGLIGGMSWESSLEYYRLLNEGVKVRLGGYHSAKCILFSVDFDQIETLQEAGDWTQMGLILADAARKLEAAGAELVLLCTNTMHLVADNIQQAISVPFLHIADAAGEAVCKQGIQRVALLGTKFTMEQDFYGGRLRDRFGLDVIIPNSEEREDIHRVIFDELVLGKIEPGSRVRYVEIINRLVGEGAQGVILGCTEIGLLVRPEDSLVPVFDTTYVHASAALNAAM